MFYLFSKIQTIICLPLSHQRTVKLFHDTPLAEVLSQRQHHIHLWYETEWFPGVILPSLTELSVRSLGLLSPAKRWDWELFELKWYNFQKLVWLNKFKEITEENYAIQKKIITNIFELFTWQWFCAQTVFSNIKK